MKWPRHIAHDFMQAKDAATKDRIRAACPPAWRELVRKHIEIAKESKVWLLRTLES